MKRLKVGYICSDFDIPLFGDEGCSVRIREFTNALVDEGHDVFLLCAEVGDPSGATVRARVYDTSPSGFDAMALGVLEEDPITYPRLDRDLRLVMQNLWLRGDSDGIVARERPDLLYEVSALFGFGGLALARRYGIPHILEVNAPLCIEQEGYKKFTLTGTARRMEQAIAVASDAVVSVSDWLRDYLISQGVDADRAYVIPNGVAERLFSAVGSGDAVKAELGLAGKRVVGFVGTFHPWHDVRLLLQAFVRVAAKDEDVSLLLVGDGPGRRAAQEQAESLGVANRVVFTGAVLHERIPELIAAMDVAVAPFVWKEDHLYGSPMKLFEYMAAGRPSVSTAIEQTTQIIEHGRTGWLCPPGDDAAIADGISALLYTRGLAEAVGAAGREKIMREFTWRGLARQVASIASELIEGRRPLATVTAGTSGR